MNQNDQLNAGIEKTAANYPDKLLDNKRDTGNTLQKEWVPEDDDDWYEPDYARNERRGN